MNAITMLEDDHREVERMLDELEPTTERAIKTRTELFERLKEALSVHEIIEEEIFYPALREHPKAKDIVLEAYEEHNVVDSILGELERLPVDDETWGAKAMVMIENLRHHIEEEEKRDVPDGAAGLRGGRADRARRADGRPTRDRAAGARHRRLSSCRGNASD